MSDIVRARVEEPLLKLRLEAVAQRLDGILSQAARVEPMYLDFLDQVLTEEIEAKQKKRVAMGIQIVNSPAVKTLEEFELEFQPSIDAKLARVLATARFIAGAALAAALEEERTKAVGPKRSARRAGSARDERVMGGRRVSFADPARAGSTARSSSCRRRPRSPVRIRSTSAPSTGCSSA